VKNLESPGVERRAGDHAMTNDNIDATVLQPDADVEERLFDTWFDPIENAVRDRVRSFIEEVIEDELEAVLARPRYGRRAKNIDEAGTVTGVAGHRHGSRTRTLTGTFGRTEITMPRAPRATGWQHDGMEESDVARLPAPHGGGT
jgi:hypothetical protein